MQSPVNGKISLHMWNPFKSKPSQKRANKVATPTGAENFLLVTYDSCRYDAYLAAKTPVLDAHVQVRQAYSQATYTYAAHASMFQGLLPHVFTPEPYYNRFVKQMWRLQHRKATARVMMPEGAKSIIDGFNQLGYYTCCTGAMAWFRRNAQLREFWQGYEWTGIDARRQIDWTMDQLNENADKPFFAFINFGETHSPYRFEGQGGSEGDAPARKAVELKTEDKVGEYDNTTFSDEGFDESQWKLQVACVEYLDARMGELLAFFKETGRDVTVVMCGDHGECFGENGLFGHGFYHPKVMEVPMAIFDFKANTSF